MAKRKKAQATAEIETAPVVEAVKPKQRGRVSKYSADEKAAFSDGIKNGRAAGASWAEVHEAAIAQGFKDGLPYLKTFAPSSAIKNRKPAGRPKGKKANEIAAPETGTAPAVAAELKQRGRPKGSKNKKKTVAYKSGGRGKIGPGDGLAGVNAIVARMIDERVAAAMVKAVAALETAMATLRAL